MKKSLLAMLLAVALAVPAFATEKGAMELNAKVGFVLSPTFSQDVESEKTDSSCDMAMSLGLDFYYYVVPQIALGVGLEHVFNSNIEDSPNWSVGNTSLFAQAKYVIDTGNDIFNNVYPMLQVGYGMFNFSGLPGEIDTEGGLCWGVGFGTTMKESFIVELVYGINYGALKNNFENFTIDLKYSAFKVKVGYKFAI